MAKIGFLGLVIDGELKETLKDLAKKEKRTQTVLVEQALRNFFKSKKILIQKVSDTNKNKTL